MLARVGLWRAVLCAATTLVLAATATSAYAYVTYLRSWTFGSISAAVGWGEKLAVGPDGTIYVVDFGEGKLLRFSSTGKLLGTVGKPSISGLYEPGTARNPMAVAIAPDGTVVVLDSIGEFGVERFTPQGEFISHFATGGECQLTCGNAVAVAPDGSILVSKGGADKIERYSPTGTLENTWGEYGTTPGKLGCNHPIGVCGAGPWALTVSPHGEVYVADTYNNRVEVFTLSGSFLRAWPAGIDAAAIALRPNGDVLVPNEEPVGYGFPGTGGGVNEYDPTGRLIRQFGTFAYKPGVPHPTVGAIQSPGGLAIGPSGALYVGDIGSDPEVGSSFYKRVQVFEFDDSGIPALGSLSSEDVAAHISMKGGPYPEKQCPERGLGPRSGGCAAVLDGMIRWTVGCQGIGGTPAWAVALRPASEPLGNQTFYAPPGFEEPLFVPGPPTENALSRQWQLPDGTPLGREDPRKRTVLEFGSAATPKPLAEEALDALVGPGSAVRPTLLGECRYTMSDGSTEAVGIEVDSNGLATPPAAALPPRLYEVVLTVASARPGNHYRQRRRHLRVSFLLSANAAVHVTLLQEKSGRRRGAACVARHPAPRRHTGKSCVVTSKVAALLIRHERTGRNTVALRVPLSRGVYKIKLQASNKHGRSEAIQVPFALSH